MSNQTGAARLERASNQLSKQELRASVLRVHYELNEDFPGIYANSKQIAEQLGVETRLVVGAGLYLIDKGFLDPGKDGIVEEHGKRGLSEYFARITDRGIDFTEDPDDWRGHDVPPSLVYMVAGGDISGIAFAARDLQSVGGNVGGILAQGDAELSN